jgi:drug/metabolite transporter (DMT)-like permease
MAQPGQAAAGVREYFIMLRKPHIRRPLAALLVILGAALLFLAPETWAGILLLILGVLLEVTGIAIKHRDQHK